MYRNPAVVMRLVASAYAVAERAGSIVRKVLQSGDLGITGANDLQTLADRLAQQSICASLSKHFPKITIIGEEELGAVEPREDLMEEGQAEAILQKSCPLEYQDLKEEELVVWVDPLDGTKEYTEGADLGRTMWGLLGLGTFGIEVKEVPDNRRIITTTPTRFVTDCVDAMEPHEVIRVGGAGNKHMNSAGVLATLHNHQYYVSRVPPSVLSAL
ncbi:hypothetical protein CRUP_027951 [Coryphaenoides rupestris]|nr:hypothetical protein CRUP_027951 [Coryphaenoides rupestris]